MLPRKVAILTIQLIFTVFHKMATFLRYFKNFLEGHNGRGILFYIFILIFIQFSQNWANLRRQHSLFIILQSIYNLTFFTILYYNLPLRQLFLDFFLDLFFFLDFSQTFFNRFFTFKQVTASKAFPSSTRQLQSILFNLFF